MVLGEGVEDEVLDGFEIVKEARTHTLGKMKPGVPCRDVAAVHDSKLHGRPRL